MQTGRTKSTDGRMPGVSSIGGKTMTNQPSSTRRGRPARTTLLTGVLAGSVLVAGVATAATVSSASGIAACIKSGSIRVLDDGETCKDNEQPVTLRTGEGDEVTSAMIVDGTITGADLAEPFLSSLLTTESSVPWDMLTNIPDDLADGDDVDGGVASDLDCTGCLTEEDLGTGSVTTDDLADGSVTSSKLQAYTAASTPDSATIVTGGWPTSQYYSYMAPATLPASDGTAAHAVMLNGQFEAGCQRTCPLPGEVLYVEWQLMRAGRPVGPTYSEELTATDTTFVGSVSAIDDTALSQASYSILVQVPSTPWGSVREVEITTAVLNVVDLGRR